MTPDFQHARYRPYEHQKRGVARLINSQFLLLADEMGLGKTKQVIDAAQNLYRRGMIDKVLIICPSAVKPVWYDPEFGEISKHFWKIIPHKIGLFGTAQAHWTTQKASDYLVWVVTNYEFIRRGTHLAKLRKWLTRKTLLVLDESSYVKSHKAKQTLACMELRSMVDRVYLLNGTPVSNSPLDLFSQGNLLHTSILDCQYVTYFKAQYATTQPLLFKDRPKHKQPVKIIGWPGLDRLRELFKPHVLRRLKNTCLDLPPKLPPVTITVPLQPETWKMYKSMRDEMIVQLQDEDATVARQAVVKLVRLSQITSGILGGFESDVEARVIGDEKKKAFLEWYDLAIQQNPNLKLLVWCRFLREVEELFGALMRHKASPDLEYLIGGQKKDARRAALQLLDPRSAPGGPAVLIGVPSTGKTGLNLAAASSVVYISADYSLFTRMQSEDRVHRPGQVRPVSYFDFVATGPQGQQTIDSIVIRALYMKREIAKWTTKHWVTALKKSAEDRPLFIPRVA